MKTQFDNSVSDARAETAGGAFSPVARKPLKTPVVIVGTLDQSENGGAGGADGGPTPPSLS